MKPTILINWDYKREDITNHLYKLSDHFDLVFLYYYNERFTPKGYKAVCWYDYKTPNELIKVISPIKILFHDIESFHQISLNIVAQASKIETIVLEHGLRRGEEIAIQYNQIHTPNSKSPLNNSGTMLFLLSSFIYLKPSLWLKYIRLIYIRKKFGLTVGLHKAQYRFREANKYINFTPLNSTYIIERDGIEKDKIIYTGNPQFDPFFLKLKNGLIPAKQPFIVLIDSPFEDELIFNMKEDVKRQFFEKISAFCKRQNQQFIVKLHPRSYHRNYAIEGITFDRSSDPMELISQASGCIFLHLSGLLPLSLLLTKTIFFNTFPEYNREIVESKLVNVYDFYDFEIDDLFFEEINKEKKNTIINDYFYKIDGLAVVRIIQAISN